MTITRLFQAGAEMQHVNEVTVPTGIGTSGGVSIITSSRTGGFAFLSSSGSGAAGAYITSTTQIRAGVYVRHNGNIGSSSRSSILGVVTDMGTPFCRVQWNANTNNLELIVGNSSVATISATTAGFTTTATYYHVGITYKANASTGFFSAYLDGTQILTYSGNTGTAITGCFFGGGLGTSFFGWNSGIFDDFYIDDTVGEADLPPPSPRFAFLLPNGAGSNTAWTANTGSNYQCVDDTGVPDDDTTYVYASTTSLKDSYALTNTTAGVTVPSGYSIAAVIPIAWARKTDSSVSTQLKVGTRLSGTDVLGSANALGTSYGPVWTRQTTKPGGGAWSESDVDSTEFLMESA